MDWTEKLRQLELGLDSLNEYAAKLREEYQKTMIKIYQQQGAILMAQEAVQAAEVKPEQ